LRRDHHVQQPHRSMWIPSPVPPTCRFRSVRGRSLPGCRSSGIRLELRLFTGANSRCIEAIRRDCSHFRGSSRADAQAPKCECPRSGDRLAVPRCSPPLSRSSLGVSRRHRTRPRMPKHSRTSITGGSLRFCGAMPRFAARPLLRWNLAALCGGCRRRWRFESAWRTNPRQRCRTPPSRGNAPVWRKEQVVSLVARAALLSAGLDKPAAISGVAVVSAGVVKPAFP